MADWLLEGTSANGATALAAGVWRRWIRSPARRMAFARHIESVTQVPLQRWKFGRAVVSGEAFRLIATNDLTNLAFHLHQTLVDPSIDRATAVATAVRTRVLELEIEARQVDIQAYHAIQEGQALLGCLQDRLTSVERLLDELTVEQAEQFTRILGTLDVTLDHHHRTYTRQADPHAWTLRADHLEAGTTSLVFATSFSRIPLGGCRRSWPAPTLARRRSCANWR